MNSRASNSIKLHTFWHYSTDLGTNSYGRDQIVYQFVYQYSITIHIELIQTTSISVKVYEYRRYLVLTKLSMIILPSLSTEVLTKQGQLMKL